MNYARQSYGGSRTTTSKTSAAAKARKGTTANQKRVNKPTSSAKATTTKAATRSKTTTKWKAAQKQALPKLAKGYAWEEVPAEKRAAMVRKKASQDFLKIKERAMTQTMYVLDRKQTGSQDQPEETIQMAGTTGNVYTIKINRRPTCDCPAARDRKQCKHIVYVLAKTLKAPEELQYQHGLLTSELELIFANAPPIPSQRVNTEDKNRKPIDPEDDCPICCEEFGDNMDNVTYCSGSCGNNVHEKCFQKWADSAIGGVKCPFCRAAWESKPPDLDRIAALPGRKETTGNRTYRNLGRELNLHGPTDLSTYHMWNPWR